MNGLIEEIKDKLNNIVWTPSLIFELTILLLIIASGGWLFLLLVGAVYPGHTIFKYEVEILSQILDGIFTYVCLMASLPRVKLFLGISKIFQFIDNNFDENDILISSNKLHELVKQLITSDYLFLFPNLPDSENNIETGNPLSVENQNDKNLFTLKYLDYRMKVRNGLLLLYKVSILLNLNWIFQIPNTVVMLWFASIIPCGNHCAFEHRPAEVIGVFLPLSFVSAAAGGLLLLRHKMASQ